MIVSNPQGALVFTDDAFAGLTTLEKLISLAKLDWFKEAQADGCPLWVRRVPYGNIQLRLRGIPDFDFESGREIEVKISVKELELE